MWNQPHISVITKVMIYRAVVISTVLYGSECWTCTKNEYEKLNIFNTKRLRIILGMRRDEISNKELYKATGMPKLADLVRKNRLRWAGHVRRIEDDKRWPKRILFGELKRKGTARRGAPDMDWDRCLKEDCERISVIHSHWREKAKDRVWWRSQLLSLNS